MSRYTGPRLRILRRLDSDLPGLTGKNRERRPYPPGQHGQGRRRRPSEYGMQLSEKQKLCHNYGVGDTQMRNLYALAKAKTGVTGDTLLNLLERRLDNVVFRAGLAPTIPAARQLVVHGHVHIDGKRVDRPSYRVRPGQLIGLHQRVHQLPIVTAALDAPRLPVPSWIDRDTNQRTVKVTGTPDGAQPPFEIDLQLVVEYYSRF